MGVSTRAELLTWVVVSRVAAVIEVAVRLQQSFLPGESFPESQRRCIGFNLILLLGCCCCGVICEHEDWVSDVEVEELLPVLETCLGGCLDGELPSSAAFFEIYIPKDVHEYERAGYPQGDRQRQRSTREEKRGEDAEDDSHSPFKRHIRRCDETHCGEDERSFITSFNGLDEWFNECADQCEDLSSGGSGVGGDGTRGEEQLQ